MNITNNLLKFFLLMVTATSLAEQQPKPVPFVSAHDIPLNATQLRQFVDNHFLKNGNIIVPLKTMYQKKCVGTARLENQKQCEQFELFFGALNNTQQELYTKRIQPLCSDRNLSDEKKQSIIAHHINAYIQIFNSIFVGFNATVKNEDDLQTGSTFLKNILTPGASTSKPAQPKKQLTFFGQPLFRRQ